MVVTAGSKEKCDYCIHMGADHAINYREGDWVAQEIAGAIEQGIPIYPVLIENTPMPRAEELPEKLQPLLRYNALSITDRRWPFDVQRLGKIITLDVASANERKLDLARLGISIALCGSLVWAAGLVARNYLCRMCGAGAGCPEGTRFCEPELCGLWTFGAACNPNLIERWQAGIPFVAIMASSLLLVSLLELVAKDRRPYLVASIVVGALGSLLFYSIQLVLGTSEEALVGFFGATLLVTVMFGLMNMSGFEAK